MSQFAQTESIAERAQQIAVEIVERFGARPAGSEAEDRARSWTEELLRTWGYSVKRQLVSFPPFPQRSFSIALIGLYLAVSSWLIYAMPIAAVLAPVCLYFLPNLLRWEIKRRKTGAASENLYAAPDETQTGKRLLLVAHLDTAPVRGVSGMALRLYGRSLDLAQRMAFAVAAGAILKILGLSLPQGLVFLLGTLGAAAGGWLAVAELLNQYRAPGNFSPGANDNASGVGAVLALAQYFASHPVEHLRIEVLISTAEETGMHGARAFARSLDLGSGYHILAFDMVGTGGDLRYAVRDGTWRALKFSEQMNESIRQTIPGSTPLWYIEKSGDHAPFIEAGFPAAALQVTGSPTADLRYHSADDTADFIELRAVQLAVTAALAVIKDLASP